MKTSIIIPTKNRPCEVKRLLSQVFKQSYKAHEIIVVDDSENLETKRLIEKCKNLYLPRKIRLRHIWDSGSSSRARLIGGLIAEGDIIVYIDDDLVLQHDSLEILVKNLLEKRAIAVWGKIHLLDLKTTRLNKLFSTLYYQFLFGISKKYGGGFLAIRRKVLEDKVWYDWNLTGYSLYEDKDFASNLCKHYGLENIINMDRDVAIEKGVLIKDKKYYKQAIGNTLYYSKKWGGTIHLFLAFFIVLPLLCIFYMISIGGRGISSVQRKDVLKSCLETVKNLSLILAGKLDEAYN